VRRFAATVAALAALGLAASACSSSSDASSFTGQVVDPPFQVSSIALEDTDGSAYSLTTDTDKRLTLVFFGYTNCPDICPAVMSNLAAAMTRLDSKDRDQLDVVFVSTDPARDTTTVLRKYLDRYDRSFLGLTDPPEKIQDIAKVAQSLAVGLGDRLPTGGYDSTSHTTQVTAIDSDDQAPMYWDYTTSPAQYAHDIHALLNG
jgi:protein SCO1